MKEVTKYLLDRGVLKNDSIYWIKKHRKWCDTYGTSPVTIKFTEVVIYIEELMFQYQDITTVNNIVVKVNHYYEYLLATQKIKRNLFSSRYLVKEKKRIFAIIELEIEVPNKYDLELV